MFTFGGDPEVFLELNGKFVSAEDENGPIIPGTKKKPHPVKGGAVQVDGVACEFNINPSKNYNEFMTSIRDTVYSLKDMVRAVNKDFNLKPVPTAYFDKEYFDKLPAHVRKLGCDPDFNAQKNGEVNAPPSTDEPFRTGSGHVVIGWTKDRRVDEEGHLNDCILVTKELDRYLYYASLDWDTDENRRKLYGQLGSFRPKPYGVEYRVLSNAWLKDTQTIRKVFNLTKKVVESIDSGRHRFYDPKNYRKNCNSNYDAALRALGGW
jgi:hypothetical protein